MNFKKFSQPGFVILFTIIISVIIFMMGLGIYSIAIRQTTLSSTAREAGQAFYAADAGIECALVAERYGLLTMGLGGSVECNGEPIPILEDTKVFPVMIGEPNGPCAIVNVFTGDDGRRIISQGFNDCDNGVPDEDNPRLVERNLDVFYPLGTPVTP